MSSYSPKDLDYLFDVEAEFDTKAEFWMWEKSLVQIEQEMENIQDDEGEEAMDGYKGDAESNKEEDDLIGLVL